MIEGDNGHLVAGVALIIAATVALCTGHLSEAAWLGSVGAGGGVGLLKGLAPKA